VHFQAIQRRYFEGVRSNQNVSFRQGGVGISLTQCPGQFELRLNIGYLRIEDTAVDHPHYIFYYSIWKKEHFKSNRERATGIELRLI
jgi:hypothetical protein